MLATFLTHIHLNLQKKVSKLKLAQGSLVDIKTKQNKTKTEELKHHMWDPCLLFMIPYIHMYKCFSLGQSTDIYTAVFNISHCLISNFLSQKPQHFFASCKITDVP